MLYPGNPSHMKGYTKAQNKGMEKIYRTNGEQKTAGVAIVFSDKIDFKATKIKKDKEGHYMIKRIDTTRRANNCKYIWTQYRSTQIYKASS